MILIGSMTGEFVSSECDAVSTERAGETRALTSAMP